MSGDPHRVLASIRHRLVVSCQAYPGEAMRDSTVMTAVARAAVAGGAVAIRAQGLDDIVSIRRALTVPLIGLLKRDGDDVFITPTVVDASAVAAAGADVVALDATPRDRPDGHPLLDSINAVHAAGKLVMADCSCLQDAYFAVASGADCVGTTLAGYTPSRPLTDGPDFRLLDELVRKIEVPVVAEGRIRTPEEARRCLEIGAFSVVVGAAITHPTSIAASFVNRLHPGVE